MLMDYMQAKALLDKYGIKSVDSAYVSSAQEAVSFAKHDAIVLKALSDKALHKTKAGLVMLNLSTDSEIEQAYKTLEQRAKKFAPYKILAQKMSKGGVETIIGGSTDDQFGKAVMLGFGGIYVEVFKDTSLRLCPLTRYDAEEMISELKSKNVITYNGKAEKMLVSLLLRFSKMFSENDSLREVDLNPVVIRQNDYEALDLRLLTNDDPASQHA
ncbi:MAG: acetate--CoA ligase family protein [Candidatus Micrarchaeia archaeon]